MFRYNKIIYIFNTKFSLNSVASKGRTFAISFMTYGIIGYTVSST